MAIRYKIIFLLATLCFTPNLILAKQYDLGTVGRTWEIVEPDALQEFQERAAAVDWVGYIKENREAAVRNYRPKKRNASQSINAPGGWLVDPLPAATRDTVYFVDMTYTLEMDVPDGRGGILYPKGYQFNPLDYVSYPNTIVIIDGERPEQVNWFLASPFKEDQTAKLLISRGSWQDLNLQLQRPVYYLTDKIASRLQIMALPSVVQQRGNQMEVRQIFVPDDPTENEDIQKEAR